jgi:hypothetical protein
VAIVIPPGFTGCMVAEVVEAEIRNWECLERTQG